MNIRFRQKPLHTLERRAGVWLRRWFQNRFVQTTRVRRVRLGGHSYKRISFHDSWRAESAARVLERVRRLGLFPELVAEFENELLVEFVLGEILPEAVDAAAAEKLARFFAALYSVDPQRLKTEETPFPAALRRDLGFLRSVGILASDAHGDLVATADATAPAEVWVGLEYVDPLPKNFVATPDGRLVAIDVDALRPGQLIGIGAAKTMIRSLPDHREVFHATLRRHCALDLEDSLPFAELCFLADWQKILFLKGRNRLVDPTLFERYRRSGYVLEE